MAANWFIPLRATAVLSTVRSVVIPGEEAQSVAVFGDDHRRYQRGTGSLLPSVSRKGRV